MAAIAAPGSPEWKQGESLRMEIHLAPSGLATFRNMQFVGKIKYRKSGNAIEIGTDNAYMEILIEPHCLVLPGGVRLWKQ